jgi:hypothetical protein
MDENAGGIGQGQFIVFVKNQLPRLYYGVIDLLIVLCRECRADQEHFEKSSNRQGRAVTEERRITRKAQTIMVPVYALRSEAIRAPIRDTATLRMRLGGLLIIRNSRVLPAGGACRRSR